jgi:hypothetical protein
MTSDRKIAANRNNSKKSTGARSKAGREASRRNALRHGLAIDIGTIPAFHGEIETLAKTLSSDQQEITECAREAAAAEPDLFRIRKVRAGVFETVYFADTAAQDGLADWSMLAPLERYERRAFSRRKRALRAIRKTD